MSAGPFENDEAVSSASAGPVALASAIRARAGGLDPRIAVVLGSGWSGLADRVEAAIRIPYADLPGFPPAGVAGHAGELVLGRLGPNPVAVMSGRRHVYETGDVGAMRLPLRALAALGCHTLVQTNAAGSLRTDWTPGRLMLLADHLNPSQRSPLVGEAGAARFVDMRQAYDPALRRLAREVAARAGLRLDEGVYVWTLGPQFETPAEIRMFRAWGGDAVGMSTVPETLIARHAGMRVLALSLITNLGAGLSTEKLSHAHTLAQAAASAETSGTFLAELIAALPSDAAPA